MCSLSTDFSACKAIPNALEEATFLYTPDMLTDEEAPVVAAAAWSLLSHMLLPSSTALRALQVLWCRPLSYRVVCPFTFCSAASKTDSSGTLMLCTMPASDETFMIAYHVCDDMPDLS